MPRVLLIGTFQELLAQREHAFESAGYEVQVSIGLRGASRVIERAQFDAVVIGHAIEGEERKQLVSAIRAKQSSCKIVCLYLGSIHSAEAVNAVLQVTSPVDDLVHAVEELVASEHRSQSA